MSVVAAAVRVRGRVCGVPAAPPMDARQRSAFVPVEGRVDDSSGTTSRTSCRPHSNTRTSPSTQPANGSGTARRARSSRCHSGAPMASSAAQVGAGEAAVAATYQPPPARSQKADDAGGGRTVVKAEEVFLSPGVVSGTGSDGAGIAVARGLGAARNKKRVAFILCLHRRAPKLHHQPRAAAVADAASDRVQPSTRTWLFWSRRMTKRQEPWNLGRWPEWGWGRELQSNRNIRPPWLTRGIYAAGMP